MAIAEELQILVNAKVDKAVRELGKVDKSIGKTASTAEKLTSTFKALAGPIAIGGVIAGLVKIGKESLDAASDAEETDNKFHVVFSSLQDMATTAAESIADGYGLSSTASKQLLSDTGDLLTGFGFTQKSALDLSIQVTELGADLASFTNFSGGAKGASDALTKALLGERESVKSLGISILDADVKARVLENTQKGLTFETDRQAAAYATLQIAQDQSKNAIGDFARSQDSFANQSRIAAAETENLGKAFGESLLPIATKAISLYANLTGELADYLDRQNAVKKALNELKDKGSNSEENQVVLLKEQLRLENLNLDAAISARKAMINLNEEQSAAADATVQRQKDVVKGIQDVIDAYDIQDSFLIKAADSARVLAQVEIDAADKKKANSDLEIAAQGKLEDIRQGRLSSEEKEIKNLQQQIDTWAQYRDIVGVQQLLNELIKDRNALQKEVDKQNAISSKIDLDRYNQNLTQEQLYTQAIIDRAERQKKSAEEIAQAEIDAAKKTKEAWEYGFDQISSDGEMLLSTLGSLFTAYTDAAISEIDRQLQADLEAAGLAEETEKGRLERELQEAKDKGDAETAKKKEDELARLKIKEAADKKKKQILREEAKREKALAILQTILSTAAGVAKSLELPFPYNLVAAAITGAAGAVQIGIAASEPLPAAAEGGSFVTKGPTKLLVGDNIGGQEEVTVKPVSSNGANEISNSGGKTFILLIDGKPFKAVMQEYIDNRVVRSSKGGAI